MVISLHLNIFTVKKGYPVVDPNFYIFKGSGRSEEKQQETADILEEMAEETMKDEAPSSKSQGVEERKVFQFSGLSPEEKMEMKTALDALGGELLESSNFEYDCTHLIVKQPARNEKFLACVASGRYCCL